MIFHAKRCYSIKNLLFNGNIIKSREIKYKIYKPKKTTNIYLIRKYNAKQKRKIF